MSRTLYSIFEGPEEILLKICYSGVDFVGNSAYFEPMGTGIRVCKILLSRCSHNEVELSADKSFHQEPSYVYCIDHAGMTVCISCILGYMPPSQMGQYMNLNGDSYPAADAAVGANVQSQVGITKYVWFWL